MVITCPTTSLDEADSDNIVKLNGKSVVKKNIGLTTFDFFLILGIGIIFIIIVVVLIVKIFKR